MAKTLCLLLFIFVAVQAKIQVSDPTTYNYTFNSWVNVTSNTSVMTLAKANFTGTDVYYKSNISDIAQNLDINITYDSKNELTIRVVNAEKVPRFEMDHQAPYSFTKVKYNASETFEYTVGTGDGLVVSRALTNEVIFDTRGSDFLVSEYFTNLTIKLPSPYLYGLGERARDFLYDSGIYTIWNKDQFATTDEGQGNHQTYGFHPVYLMREASGNWHMVYLRTTNAMDFVFDADKKTLNYALTAGFFEFKIFLGDKNPDTAIKLYHQYINGWEIQPFWSHGYHQCRWGYLFLNNFTDVVSNMSANGLPLDVIWSDIDYMDNFTDFTFDQDRYNLTEFRDLVSKVHWIPIIDAGVFINYTSPAYNIGNEYDVWIRSALNNSNYLVGIVWPGLVYWPDWINPNASIYWEEMLELLYNQAPFSGIWLDMNENSNFCTGEFADNCFVLPNYLPDGPDDHINPYNQTINPIPLVNVTQPDIQNGTEVPPAVVAFNSTELPYVPGGVPLESSTISINALHFNGVLEFDFHNLNSLWEGKYTYESIYNITHKRPFILSRSTHVGSGQFTTHWTGDNTANWTMLRLSIPEIFNFQLFGIPMVGADICGFAGDTTEELCARWMQLGAFYPFMRNHNKIDAINQEPYALGPVVLETSRQSLLFRYSILKFYYSIFIRNNHLGTVFRPLFFDFSEDALLTLQTQFLIGSELMVAAVVDENVTNVDVYFPAGPKWFDFATGDVIKDQSGNPDNVTIAAPLQAVLPVFIKGGSIVHTQNTTNVLSTVDLDNQFSLVVALQQTDNATYLATGTMMSITNYQDDGAVEGCLGTHDCLIAIQANTTVQANGTSKADVRFARNSAKSYLEGIYITDITFYGVRDKICKIGDTKCAGQDHVIQCTFDKPRLVSYETVSFQLQGAGEKGVCVFHKDL